MTPSNNSLSWQKRFAFALSFFGLASLANAERSDDSSYQLHNWSLNSGESVSTKGLPFAVDIYTSDYLYDVGATTFRGVPGQAYGAGTQTRMGFRYQGIFDFFLYDSVNVSELEWSRGPSSILYGVNNPAGMVNVEPKQPQEEAQYTVSIFANDTEDESGYFRTSLEATGPIYKGDSGDVLAYRFAASFDEEGGDDLNYYVGQLQYENDKLVAFAEVQHGSYESNFGTSSIDEILFDFFAEYEETSVLLNADLTPVENLVVSLGVLFSDTESEGRDAVFWPSEQSESSDSQSSFTNRETIEYRLDATYSFQANDLFGRGKASHKFSVGVSELVEENGYNSYGSLSNGFLYPGDDLSEFESRGRSFGGYLMYEGSFLDEKLGLTAGVRTNDYNSWVNELGMDRTRISTIDHSGEVSSFVGLSYNLNEQLSIYANYEEGMIPDLIDDLQELDYDSERHEIGVKFSALDGRLNGRVSGYRIEKEGEGSYETVQYTSGSVRGREIIHGVHESVFRNVINEFEEGESYEPVVIRTDDRVLYGVDHFYFEEEGIDPDALMQETIDEYVFVEYGELDESIVVDDGVDTGFTWRHFLEQAFEDASQYDPIYDDELGQDHLTPNLTVTPYDIFSSEEIDGVDLNINFAPNENWEFLFSYSHEEATTRNTVTSTVFSNVVYYDELGNEHTFGTEYDLWVRIFGREAFGLTEVYEYDENGEQIFDANGNPKVIEVVNSEREPVTVGDVAPGELTDGILPFSYGDTFSTTSDQASLLANYSFSEGRLEGLSLFGALRYQKFDGGVWTGDVASVSSPFSIETDTINLGVSYEWEMSKVAYRLSLNIDNVEGSKTETATYRYLDSNSDLVEEEVELDSPGRSYQLRFMAEF
ncbi:TonB-dependent receptor [Puniceicoccaceae bacterium K14]|nr:TonB-dependent receptor [Puniceicoccaceae bacterium K14]